MKATVKYTTREDGNGKPIAGFYVVVNGIAIGCARKTYEAAYADYEAYLRDLRKMLSVG